MYAMPVCCHIHKKSYNLVTFNGISIALESGKKSGAEKLLKAPGLLGTFLIPYGSSKEHLKRPSFAFNNEKRVL